jgi:hypothetical protein
MTTEDKKISDLYRQASAVEPPDHLDDAILAASRRGVKQQPRAKSPFSGGWPVPVAMAAVVIVAVVVVPLVTQEAKQDRPVPERAISDLPAAAPAMAPKKKQASSSLLMKSPQEFKQPAIMDEQLMEERFLPEAPAASAPPSLLYEMDSSDSETVMGRSLKQNRPAAARMERTVPAAQDLKKKERAKDFRKPEDWLAHINELIAAEDIEKATIELKAFKQSYPDHPIDLQLQELLD